MQSVNNLTMTITGGLALNGEGLGDKMWSFKGEMHKNLSLCMHIRSTIGLTLTTKTFFVIIHWMAVKSVTHGEYFLC